MNGIIKYPNGQTPKNKKVLPQKTINKQKSHLGIDFETAINEANTYYLAHQLACIYKKPTPIQIVKVDYPARNKARIVEAYYRMPSTTDYNGIYKGYYIDFEAKSCHSNSFSFNHIYLHQIKHLQTVMNMGGISFIIVEFSLKKEIFVLHTKYLLEQFEEAQKGGRQSIPYQYFVDKGYRLTYGLAPTIDYLKAVDQLIASFNGKENN